VQPWEPGLAAFDQGQGNRMTSSTPCFVGVPSMLSIVEHLAQDIDIVFHAHVGRIARGSAEWFLFDGHERPLGIAGFDGLVLALPSVLALELVRGVPELAGALGPRLAAVQWDACWTASVVLSRLSGIEFDAAFIRDDPILVWAAREGSKPRRSNPPGMPERWLLQARASWSNNFARLAPDEAGRWMQRAFAARLARPLQQKSCYAVHWPQASPTGSLGAPFHWDAPLTFGLAGDWCSGASIESAFLSGSGVAQAIAS